MCTFEHLRLKLFGKLIKKMNYKWFKSEAEDFVKKYQSAHGINLQIIERGHLIDSLRVQVTSPLTTKSQLAFDRKSLAQLKDYIKTIEKLLEEKAL